MLTKRAIQKILNECAFNPREEGPFKIIADQGKHYYHGRALEAIHNKEYRQAIWLMALLLYYNENE